MPKLLQINVTSNWGSTGKIVEQIGLLAKNKGWESYLAYGRYSNPSGLSTIKVGNKFNIYEHFFEHIVFDNNGLASRYVTLKFIKHIKNISPDIIHLHNIHGYWINYELLFNYLKTLNIPILWTLHDCWPFTGRCGHYTINNCSQWQKSCDNCALNKGKLFPLKDNTHNHFERKRKLFQLPNLTLVPVSHWLEGEVKKSFLKDNYIHQIYNGIDISLFHPVDNVNLKKAYGILDKKILIGVSSKWNDKKGLNDYYELAKILAKNVIIILVGLDKRQVSDLPNNIIGITRTQDQNELVNLYSIADIVMNLSYEETFGLTTVEGMACGTPAIVYNSTASPELVSDDTGIIVEPGDIKGVLNAVNDILVKSKAYYTHACRNRALELFDKDDRFNEYISLYNELLGF